ncbi:MAG TPA: 23S rRNA pseudouridine(1911/1915/1917) synthase RluD [Gammaproteobacteria bacterium]|nr:23S rRNA pseudouridine(1911/1915/1917) synthase RluD [Gammaproteobacteria bacterium]
MQAQQVSLTGTIQPEFAGCRLDQALAQLFPEYSRERLKTWVLEGYCKVDGSVLRPKDKVVGGEQVTIEANVLEAVTWQGEDLPLDIVYEDEDLLVINKAANVVVHPAAGNPAGTLVNALLNYVPELSNIPRAGIVHRLDKDTTGLLVVARTLPAHTSLVEQMQERSISRIYEAVVHGIFLAGSTIDCPMGRHPRDRKKMAVVSDGREAITHYRVLTKFAKHTHIQVELETGRTHQIRVHMAHVKHPLLGDKTYAPRLQHNFPRQALHAKSLGLVHPRTGEDMQWDSELPADMQQLLKDLACKNI